SPSGVTVAEAITTTPNDHFDPSPDCCVTGSKSGRVCCVCSYPGICAGIVSTACAVRGEVIRAAPDDHLTAGPDCRVRFSARGRVDGARGCPTISAGIVSTAGVKIVAEVVPSAPDDHLTPGPHCGDAIGQRARWWYWWLSMYRRCIRLARPI